MKFFEQKRNKNVCFFFEINWHTYTNSDSIVWSWCVWVCFPFSIKTDLINNNNVNSNNNNIIGNTAQMLFRYRQLNLDILLCFSLSLAVCVFVHNILEYLLIHFGWISHVWLCIPYSEFLGDDDDDDNFRRRRRNKQCKHLCVEVHFWEGQISQRLHRIIFSSQLKWIINNYVITVRQTVLLQSKMKCSLLGNKTGMNRERETERKKHWVASSLANLAFTPLHFVSNPKQQNQLTFFSLKQTYSIFVTFDSLWFFYNSPLFLSLLFGLFSRNCKKSVSNREKVYLQTNFNQFIRGLRFEIVRRTSPSTHTPNDKESGGRLNDQTIWLHL